ncbi:MAG: ATP-binding protein [Ilumatobacteraceae bacterium]
MDAVRPAVVGSWTLLVDTLLHRCESRLKAVEGEHIDRTPDTADSQDSPTTDVVARDPYEAIIRDARAAFVESMSAGSAFASLVAAAGLTIDEAEVFAAVCAVEVDPSRQRVVGRLADDRSRQRLSLSWLATLFGPDHLGPNAVSPDSPLVVAGLVEVNAAATWASRTVGPAERVTWHLVGDDSLDPLLPLDLEIVFASQTDADDNDDDSGDDDLLLIVGADPARRLDMATARLAGNAFLTVSPPHEPEAWRAVVREATISRAGIILRLRDDLPPDARYWIERTPHLVWGISCPTQLPIESLPRRPWREIHAASPHVLPAEVAAAFPDGSADELAERRITAHQLRMIVSASAGVGGPRSALRRLASGPIEKLARRIRPGLTWADLVLPPEAETQIRELTERYRHRRLVHDTWGARAYPSPGVVALFAGPSGTGKTTAAEVVAGELGVDMFKIDLSSVVSKYIGETEKNLEELFSTAESGDMVLCFDEADSLLGKRSEVSDARDRYANLEVSYLLQRMETYEGFVVLTTNMQSNIDQAFLRRIHGRVSFPTPGPAERELIWRRSLADVPTQDLDLTFLAQRFDLVGGSIRNAALNGAFLAATAGVALSTEIALLGLKREFQKQGRLITRELFGEWYPIVSKG